MRNLILFSLLLTLISCSTTDGIRKVASSKNHDYSDLPLTVRCYSYRPGNFEDRRFGKWQTVKDEDGSDFSYTDLKVNDLFHFMSHFEDRDGKRFLVSKFVANGDPTPLLEIKEKVDMNLSPTDFMSKTYPEYHFRGFIIKCALTKMVPIGE